MGLGGNSLFSEEGVSMLRVFLFIFRALGFRIAVAQGLKSLESDVRDYSEVYFGCPKHCGCNRHRLDTGWVSFHRCTRHV